MLQEAKATDTQAAGLDPGCFPATSPSSEAIRLKEKLHSARGHGSYVSTCTQTVALWSSGSVTANVWPPHSLPCPSSCPPPRAAHGGCRAVGCSALQPYRYVVASLLSLSLACATATLMHCSHSSVLFSSLALKT